MENKNVLCSESSQDRNYCNSIIVDVKGCLKTEGRQENHHHTIIVFQEEVAHLSMTTYQMKEAQRKGDTRVFPNEARGYRYYMEQIAEQPIAEKNQNQVASTMMLEWTGALKDPNRIRQVRWSNA